MSNIFSRNSLQLPEKQYGEKDYEKRAREYILGKLPKSLLDLARENEGRILIEFIKRVSRGSLPSEIIIRDDDSDIILCTPKIFREMQDNPSDLYRASAPYIEAAIEACTCFWLKKGSDMIAKGNYADFKRFMYDSFGGSKNQLDAFAEKLLGLLEEIRSDK